MTEHNNPQKSLSPKIKEGGEDELGRADVVGLGVVGKGVKESGAGVRIVGEGVEEVVLTATYVHPIDVGPPPKVYNT